MSHHQEKRGEGDEETTVGNARAIGSFVEKLRTEMSAPVLFGAEEDDPGDTFDGKAVKLEHARAISRAQTEFYAELNLCRFPLAALYDKDTGRTDAAAQIVVQRTLWGEGEDFYWKVIPDSKYGLPGPFDRKVFRAIEKILYDRTLAKGRPLSNPQPMPPTRILQELRMGIGGRQVFLVTQGMHRLKTATIDCFGIQAQPKRTRGRPRKQARGLIWNPISNIAWAGEMDKESARQFQQTTIWMSDFYVGSFNAGNIRPIDWDLWLALKRPIAQRLYEILETRFFGLRQSPYATFGYEELCHLLPVKPQRFRSSAQRILDRAHRMLRRVSVLRADGRREEVGLVARVEWQWDGHEATLHYYPDAEYLARLKERRKAAQERNPELDTRALELAQEFGDIANGAFYQMLSAKVDWELVRIARAEALMARREGRVRKSPAAYFVAALKAEHQKRGLPLPFRTPKPAPTE